MKNLIRDRLLGIPINSATITAGGYAGRLALVPEPASSFLSSASYGSSQIKRNKVDTLIGSMNKISSKAYSYANGMWEHMLLGPKISETLRGKLNLGARILKYGGVERVFKQLFFVGEGEKLLKASQCYLSTTTGPVSGLLFISTDKIAFHSDRSLRFTSPQGKVARIPYKVFIPLAKIKRASPCENVRNQNQKCIQIITVDDFDFWFMGFVSHLGSFKYMQLAMLESKMKSLK